MICSLCQGDVPRWLWPEPDVPGGHHVIVDGPMTVRTVTDDRTMPPDRVRVIAEQTVAFRLCRERDHPVPILPPTGLDRMRAAVDAARDLHPPDHPVTLCGELDPSKPYWIGDRRVDPPVGGHAIDVGGTVHGESFTHAWPDWTTTVPTGRMVQATGRTRVPAFLRRLAERLFAS